MEMVCRGDGDAGDDNGCGNAAVLTLVDYGKQCMDWKGPWFDDDRCTSEDIHRT